MVMDKKGQYNKEKMSTPATMAQRAEKVLRLLGGSGEVPTSEDIEVLRHISALSDAEEYDHVAQYQQLLKRVHRTRTRNRILVLLKPLSGIAAALLLGFVLYQLYLYGWKSNNGTEPLAATEVMAYGTNVDSTSVLLTLRNGAVVPIKEQSEEGATAEKIRELEQDMAVAPVTEYNSIAVPRGHLYQLVLDDGSLLSFNSETRVQFPSHFSALDGVL